MTGPLGIDWELFAVYTDSGTLIERMTLQAAQYDLETWAWNQRTGGIMAKGRVAGEIAWRSILTRFGMIDDSGTLDINMKKLLSELQKDLEVWEKEKWAKQKMTGVVVAPELLKEVTSKVHKTFHALGKNKLDLNALAMAYTMNHEGEYEANRELIKAVLKDRSNSPGTFDVSGGPAPMITRLHKPNGSPTGEKPHVPIAKPSGGGAKRFQRYVDAIKTIGSKKLFDACVTELGREYPVGDMPAGITIDEFKKYVAEHAPKGQHKSAPQHVVYDEEENGADEN